MNEVVCSANVAPLKYERYHEPCLNSSQLVRNDSIELDVDCFNCTNGFLRDGSRCPICKGEGWIELLGAGEVDPNVFEYVREYGYDPERHQGFAWGMGIERIAALKYGVPDIRLLYDNDLRFLEQFG